MFLDSFLSNSWDSNDDFNTENFNQDIDAHAKLINDAVQSLTSKNLDIINTTKNTITIDLGIVAKVFNQTTEGLRNTIRNFSNKINSATLKFYNHYIGIQNTTYKAGLNSVSGDTRIDYDGNAVAFVDSMLEAFDELMSELNGFGIEMETETESLLGTINEITNEYQQSMEKALANIENSISENGNATLSLVGDANATFKQKITSDFLGYLSSAINNFLGSVGSYGEPEGFFSGLLGETLDFGGWF